MELLAQKGNLKSNAGLDLLNIEYHCVTSRNRAIAKSRKFRRRITNHFVLDSSSQPYLGRRRAIALALYGYYLNFSYPEGQIRCLVLYRPSFHFIFLYLTTGTACICVGSDLLHWDQHLHCGLVLVVSHLRISQASIYLAHLSTSFFNS